MRMYFENASSSLPMAFWRSDFGLVICPSLQSAHRQARMSFVLLFSLCLQNSFQDVCQKLFECIQAMPVQRSSHARTFRGWSSPCSRTRLPARNAPQPETPIRHLSFRSLFYLPKIHSAANTAASM